MNYVSEQQKSWSDCVYAQSDQGFRCSNVPQRHVLARRVSFYWSMFWFLWSPSQEHTDNRTKQYRYAGLSLSYFVCPCKAVCMLLSLPATRPEMKGVILLERKKQKNKKKKKKKQDYQRMHMKWKILTKHKFWSKFYQNRVKTVKVSLCIKISKLFF